MQFGDILSIRFHKIFQEAEKDRKLKTDVRKQAKTKIKKIRRPFHASFASLKLIHHLNHLACHIAGILHLCIYTLHH